MSRSRLITLGLGIGAAACAAAALVWWASADRLEFYTGAGVQRASASEHDARDILWRSPEAIGDPVTSNAENFEPHVPAGGPTANNEILFARVSESGDTDLYSAERVGRAWSPARPVSALNTLHNEQSPRLSPEGAWLYFASDRPGGEGGLDLWRAPRTSSGWGEAENLGAAINTRADDAQPAIDPSSGELWFASDREPPAHSDEDATPVAAGGFDLYRVGRSGAELVAALSSSSDEVAPAFSPVGDFVYFASAREGGAGGMDLYRARISAGAIGEARSLGPPVNTAGDELDPAPASEGFELFFARLAGDEAPTQLLRTVSREVDLARDVRYGDLAALLRLLPWILLVLAIVLLLSMLRRLASGGAAGASLGALSLMAKCVLVSLILHAILLALLSLWMVEPEAGQLADAESGTRVSLASSSIRSALESQVRDASGDPVEISAPDVVDPGAAPHVEMIAASAEPDLALSQPVSSESPQRVSVAPSSAAELRTERPPAPFPAAHTSPAEMPLATPTARAAERAQEADVRVVEALDAPSHAPMQAQTATRDALRSDAAVPLPPSSRGTDRPTRRTLDGASVGGSPEPLGLPAPLPSSLTPTLSAPTPTIAQQAVAAEPDAQIAVESVRASRVRPALLPAEASTLSRISPTQRESQETARRAPVELDVAPPRTSSDAPAVTALAPTALALPTPQGERASQSQNNAIDERAMDIPVAAPTSSPQEVVLVDAVRSAPVPQPDTEIIEQRRRPEAPDAPSFLSGARTDAPEIAQATPAVSALRLPVERPVPAAPEPDTLTGMVLDGVTSEPIEGARIRLDLADTDDASATSDADGSFTLRAMDIPDNSAISASARGYIPYSANITAEELQAGASAVVLLWPESRLTIALEEDPEVHHLGNDAFTGRVNSQFQRRAEGLTIEMPFALSEEQLPPNIAGATLLMLAKGVQLDNRFYLNGRRLQTTFPPSPRDGSFGEVAVQLPVRFLREGFNTLGIESTRRGDTDYDDFEFVNVRIQLIPANVVID